MAVWLCVRARALWHGLETLRSTMSLRNMWCSWVLLVRRLRSVDRVVSFASDFDTSITNSSTVQARGFVVCHRRTWCFFGLAYALVVAVEFLTFLGETQNNKFQVAVRKISKKCIFFVVTDIFSFVQFGNEPAVVKWYSCFDRPLHCTIRRIDRQFSKTKTFYHIAKPKKCDTLYTHTHTNVYNDKAHEQFPRIRNWGIVGWIIAELVAV